MSNALHHLTTIYCSRQQFQTVFGKFDLTGRKLYSAKRVLLATAVVRVRSIPGQFKNLRALIDQDSQPTILPEAAV